MVLDMEIKRDIIGEEAFVTGTHFYIISNDKLKTLAEPIPKDDLEGEVLQGACCQGGGTDRDCSGCPGCGGSPLRDRWLQIYGCVAVLDFILACR
jgi:hypothetical protein